jgi:ribosomal protein S18 acetylase RimI-like enzyme
MVEIRAFRPGDLEKLYSICLATGAGGEDACALYRDPKLLGHVYAAPYAHLSPGTVFVVEDAEDVGGYIVGAPDTSEFEARLEVEWWPVLRKIYLDPSDTPRIDRSADQFMSYKIHHPDRTAEEIVGPYPSHLHINLLPRLRGQGVGRRLMMQWFAAVQDMGSRGAHLAVGSANRRAIHFYRACGFHELERPSRREPAAVWFAIDLRVATDASCTEPAAG